MSSTAREGVRTGMPAIGGEAASLVESAMLLRWRAPELALLLADRAVTAAQDDKLTVVRADHLAVFALNRLGRYGEAAHRLFPAIRDADTPPGLRQELHVELAHCATALGEAATALDAVSAVLAAGDDVTPVLRGSALVAVAEASVALGCDDLVSAALDEADELYREDPSLDHDTALLLRGAVRAADAARHRRRDATAEAEAKAREGRDLLAGLADPDHDSGEVGARLMLEIALALLDRDAGEAAMQEVRSLLRRPVRAAAAASVGRLRLVLATRVHLAQGRHEPALTLLADAVEGAQRYGVDAVLAECLEGLSHVHEARDEVADALHCMRAARAAEGRHRRDVEAARSALRENCGTARREEVRLIGQVSALLGNAEASCVGSDTPEAEVAEPQVVEVEVVDPEIPQPDAPTVMPAAPDSSRVEPRTLPSDPVVQEPAEVRSVESLSRLESWQSGARHRRGAGTLLSVSDLLPASAFSAGRSGRRRAQERADETSTVEMESTTLAADSSGSVPADVSESFPPMRRNVLASGPPPAPAPRALEWEPVDGDSADEEQPPPMGLGDLLAEALAAYQESRDTHADVCGTGLRGNDGATTTEVSREVPRYRGIATRWAAGLALAAKPTDTDDIDAVEINVGKIDPSQGDPAAAVTNPLLRLPDLTAEPQWGPPAPGRLSAAGD